MLITYKTKYAVHLNPVLKPDPATFIKEAFAMVFYPYLNLIQRVQGEKNHVHMGSQVNQNSSTCKRSQEII